MSKFDSMGKMELRAACKAAGIAYGKLNNDGMRAALQADVARHNDEVLAQIEAAEDAVGYVEAPDGSAPTKAQAAAIAKAGVKIEKNREERNGIKRPSAGGKCRVIWDTLDAMGANTAAKEVKAVAEQRGWNPNNASIEFYQWRKFNGYGKK